MYIGWFSVYQKNIGWFSWRTCESGQKVVATKKRPELTKIYICWIALFCFCFLISHKSYIHLKMGKTQKHLIFINEQGL